VRTRPSAAVLIAVGLPLLLAVAVAAIGITGRLHGGGTAAPAVETGPLALVPVDAPDAAGPECAALLGALPAALPADDGLLPPRPIAEPAPPAARAWAAAPRPAVLRCGLTRPAELSPTSALLEVNGVQWLQLDGGLLEPEMTSWVAVDRPVYVVLTAPTTAGSGVLQTVADVIRQTLPRTDVAVR
jgi:hypothetical protein